MPKPLYHSLKQETNYFIESNVFMPKRQNRDIILSIRLNTFSDTHRLNDIFLLD